MADFTALTTAAAKARDELKLTAEEAKREGDTERNAAIQAAAAHDTDTAAIKRQRDALVGLAAAAKAASEAQRGGNTSAAGHLSDLQRETELQRLLNIQRQRGFYSPQQDLSYRQTELNQQRLWNIASQGGYTDRGQFLQSMRQETQLREVDNQSWAQRAVLLKSATDAVAAHSSAVDDTKSSVADLATTYGAQLDLSAYDKAADKVSALKAQVHSLGDELRNANSGLSSSEFVSRLSAIQSAAKDLATAQSQTGAGRAGVQVSGLSQVLKDVQSLGQEGGRAFDDLEQRSAKSSNSIGANFERLTTSVRDVFRSISTTAGMEADHAVGFWAKAAAGIKGALEGLASGGGGGWAKAFESLAGTSGAAVQQFFTGIGAIILGIIQLLPELTAGFAAVGASLAALPGLAIAAAGGFAIFLAAVMPVIQALTAYNKVLDAQQQAQANPAQTQMQLAQQQHAVSDAYFQVQQAAYNSQQQQITGAHAVSDAQFALTQAVVQGANQEVNAAHSVAEAQYGLKQAYFQAAMQQVQSSMQVASAQHALRDANFSAAQSQYQLNIAWQQARFQLQSLELQVSNASLNLRGAQLGLEEAQQNYEQVIRSSTSTALSRAEAAYQVQQAEAQLKQVLLSNKQNETQLADVRKYGMQQVFGVTQAQHALTDAQFAQVEAQKQLMQTQKEAANAQIVAAHQISDAVFALGQAYFNQGQTIIGVHHNIADAQFSLYEAQQQQTEGAITSYHNQKDAAFAYQTALLQQKLGIPEVASAQQQFNTALSQLGPIGQEAVKLLEPLLAWFNDFTGASDAFSKAILPALQKIPDLIKPLSSFLDTISSAAGGVLNTFLTGFEKFANSSAFDTLTQSTADVITQIGDGLVVIVGALVKLAVAATPFTDWLATGFKNIATEFANWLGSVEKSGRLTQFLNETESVLKSIGRLGKGVVDFFANIMGTTDQARMNNLQAFARLMNQLGSVILPTLGIIIGQLAQPRLRDALINLLTAVTKLLATIVQTPAFAFVVKSILDGLAAVFNLVAQISATPAVGNVLGVVVGAFTALGVLKFTHLTDLLGLLFKLPGFRLAPDWLKGLFGAPGAGPSAALDESASALSGAAADLSAAAAELGGGGAASGASGAAGAAGRDAGGATAAGAEGSVAGLLARGALRASLVLAAADIAARALAGLVPKQGQAATQEASQQAKGVGSPFAWLDQKIYGPKIDNFVAYWDKHVKDPVDNWFTHTLPSYFTDKAFLGYWQSANNWFVQYLQQPVGHFFGQLLPDWLGGAGQGWSGFITNAWNLFTNDIVGSVGKFFTNLLPDWLGGAGQGWSGLWRNAVNFFNNDVLQPLEHFFTGTLPGWFGDVANWFRRDIADPIGNWFTRTLPSAIDTAFKDAINWVIKNVVNRAIGFINDVTGIVGIPKIKPVQTLATGGGVGDPEQIAQMSHHAVPRMQSAGSVPGASDNDDQLIMATPGEFVVRKAARMTLDRKMGPGFMHMINNADQVLGYATGGEIATYASQFAGRVPYVWGGMSPRGWDCSGFTSYVYDHFGYHPPRTAAEQWNWVRKTRVPETGGLAFMAGADGTVGAPGHVGIVVAPDLMVDAYDTQSGTTFNRIYGSSGAVSGFGVPATGGGFFSGLLGLGKNIIHDLGDAAHRVAGFLGNDVIRPVFDTVWGHTVAPLIAHALPQPLTAAGAVMDYSLQSIKKGIDTKLSNMDKKNAMAVRAGPGGSGPNVQLGRQLATQFGWGSGAEWADLDALWNRESGWSNFADNPTSNAFGIPQALPFTKMPKAAWPISAGGRADPTAQILWGLQYIRGQYGDPERAWAHEQAAGWYKGGGPVGEKQKRWFDTFHDLGDDWEQSTDNFWNLIHDPWGRSHTKGVHYRPARDAALVKGLEHLRVNWEAAWDKVERGGRAPQSLNINDWITLQGQTRNMREALLDASALHSRHPAHYNMARGAVNALLGAEAVAAEEWQDLFGGPVQGPHGPGPVKMPTPAVVKLPNVLSMITGGPSAGAYGPMGFANGGTVGMPSLSMLPSLSMPAMSGLPRSLGKAMGGDVKPDRRLSEGAAASGSSASLFRDIIVQNPVPEPAGASITRNVMRLAFLAGRGPV